MSDEGLEAPTGERSGGRIMQVGREETLFEGPQIDAATFESAAEQALTQPVPPSGNEVEHAVNGLLPVGVDCVCCGQRRMSVLVSLLQAGM